MRASAVRICMTTNEPTLFVDTNILIYATRPASPWHLLARNKLDQAVSNGVELVVSPQILREYLASTTRRTPDGEQTPLSDSLASIAIFREIFRVLEENNTVVDMLLAQLQQIDVSGKKVHDANIVATMRAYGVGRLLTHNTQDFVRYNHLITVVPLESPNSPSIASLLDLES